MTRRRLAAARRVTGPVMVLSATAVMLVGVALPSVGRRPVGLRPIVNSQPVAPTAAASPGGQAASPSGGRSAPVIATVVLRARRARQGGQRRRDPRAHRVASGH